MRSVEGELRMVEEELYGNSEQLVEIIHCQDCIGKSTWYNDAEYGCAICGMSGMYPKGEFDFCSYGERKGGDGNG